MKHTPGPWRIDGSGAIAGIRPGDSGLPLAVSQVFKPIHYGDNRDSQIQFANARLIAAAPRMLEALRTALATLERYERTQETRDVIHAAIAEAE
jgi:hypothetical protein